MAVGKVIGQTLIYGYPGSFAIQPDQLTVTRVSGDDNEISFGAVVIYNDKNEVVVPTTTFTMDKFAGIAARIVKQPADYNNQNVSGYQKNEAVTVFQRGNIAVKCVKGTPKLNGDVYWVFSADDPSQVGISAEAITDKSVKLDGVKFAGDSDENGVTTVCLLTKQNV